MWRVFENFDQGTEYLVEHLDINVPCRGNITFEYDTDSYNLYCEGYISIVDGTARITQAPLENIDTEQYKTTINFNNPLPKDYT
jgi:hypothetical protein